MHVGSMIAALVFVSPNDEAWLVDSVGHVWAKGLVQPLNPDVEMQSCEIVMLMKQGWWKVIHWWVGGDHMKRL